MAQPSHTEYDKNFYCEKTEQEGALSHTPRTNLILGMGCFSICTHVCTSVLMKCNKYQPQYSFNSKLLKMPRCVLAPPTLSRVH